MTADSTILTLEAQARFFRVAEAKGHTLKTLSIDSGVNYDTLRTYKGTKGAAVMMPLVVLRALAKVPDLSADILSLLIDGTGRHLSDDVDDDGDHEATADNCLDFAARYAAARRKDSEAGEAIGPGEDRELRACARKRRVA